MPNTSLPPVYDGLADPAARAQVAGFLLHYRVGFLRAWETISRPEAAAVPRWTDPQRYYYEAADSVFRYLLHRLGYTVARGEAYPGFEANDDPFLSTLRRLDEGGYIGP